jgi:hypothetical protein
MVLLCQKLVRDGDHALRMAEQDQSPLQARKYGAGRGGKGEIHNQTAEVACARVERKGGSLYEQLCRSLVHLDTQLTVLDSLLNRAFWKADQRSARARLRQAGSGPCTACGEHVPGVGEDRRKAGLCNTHYLGLRKAERGENGEDGITRAEYITAVRQETGYVPREE